MTAVITLKDGKIAGIKTTDGDYSKLIEKPGNYIVLPVTVVKAEPKPKTDSTQ